MDIKATHSVERDSVDETLATYRAEEEIGEIPARVDDVFARLICTYTGSHFDTSVPLDTYLRKVESGIVTDRYPMVEAVYGIELTPVSRSSPRYITAFSVEELVNYLGGSVYTTPTSLTDEPELRIPKELCLEGISGETVTLHGNTVCATEIPTRSIQKTYNNKDVNLSARENTIQHLTARQRSIDTLITEGFPDIDIGELDHGISRSLQRYLQMLSGQLQATQNKNSTTYSAEIVDFTDNNRSIQLYLLTEENESVTASLKTPDDTNTSNNLNQLLAEQNVKSVDGLKGTSVQLVPSDSTTITSINEADYGIKKTTSSLNRTTIIQKIRSVV